ncbi:MULTISPECIES: MJ0042-type zinc finger domain-containing protein [Psychrobacter]|uniref:MJ0042-type zinc finger domain-containing protein n=1 Tax=Psychrobacter TaxID=497 RepID=UPI00191AC7EC
MATPIKTQCPNCHAPFNLPHAQLNQADAKARCGCFQHILLVNNHLIVPAHKATINTLSALKAFAF